MTIQITHRAMIPTTGTAPAAPRGRIGATWHRVRETVAEMNYASRRVVETQAPWTADRGWTAR
jgi:hypothetical protein